MVTHATNGAGPDTTFGAVFQAVGHDFDTISQSFATTPGTFYTLSFFYQVLNTNRPPDNHFRVLFGSNVVFDNLNAISGFGTLTFNLQAGSLTALESQCYNVPSLDFLDNVSVNGVGVPDGGSTLSLLGSGLLGLAALRRKLGR